VRSRVMDQIEEKGSTAMATNAEALAAELKELRDGQLKAAEGTLELKHVSGRPCECFFLP